MLVEFAWCSGFREYAYLLIKKYDVKCKFSYYIEVVMCAVFTEP